MNKNSSAKRVLNLLKLKLQSSDFSKNVLTLVSGTTIAQALPLFLAPILSRIYTPDDFGRLALYLAIAQILSVISGGRYELAIPLPKNNKLAVQITLLSIIIVCLVSLLIFFLVLAFSTEIAFAIGDPKLDKWLYLLPMSIFFTGIFNALNYFNVREKRFDNIAKAYFYKATGGGAIQLGLGLIKTSFNGLILGQVTSHVFGNISMLKAFLGNKKEIKSSKLSDLKKLAVRYIDFPRFSVLGILFNSLSIGVVNFFVSIQYSVTAVGFYSHAYKYLGAPVNLIANAIGQVYFQRVSGCMNSGERLEEFKKSFQLLLIIAFIIFTPLVFFIEELFTIIFGNEWGLAGVYARILIPLLAARFITSPLALTLAALEKQNVELFIQVLILIGSVGSWGYIYFNDFPIELGIKIYTICMTLIYLIILFLIYQLLKKHI